MEDSLTLQELSLLVERIQKDEYNARRDQAMLAASTRGAKPPDIPSWEEATGKHKSFEEVKKRAMQRIQGEQVSMPGIGFEED